jgi:hypothetical protein
MKCFKCKLPTIVTDSRLVNGVRQRKRQCKKGHICFTEEVKVKTWDYIDPRVKKRGVGKGKAKEWSAKELLNQIEKVRNSEPPQWVRVMLNKI